MNAEWTILSLSGAIWLGAALASWLLMALMELPELVSRRSATRELSANLSMAMSILLLAAMTYYLLQPTALPIW